MKNNPKLWMLTVIGIMQAYFFAAYCLFRNFTSWPISLFLHIVGEERKYSYIVGNQWVSNEKGVFIIHYLFWWVMFVFVSNVFLAYYKSPSFKPLVTIDFLIPLFGIAIYSPLFYYIKHKITYYYLWMDLIPLEVLSLISAGLLIANHVKEKKSNLGPGHQ